MAKKRANGEGTIYPDKRRGGWIAALIVGIDPKTGKYIRRQRSARTKVEAAEALSALRMDYMQGRREDIAALSLADWLDYYLATYKAGKVEETTLCHLRRRAKAAKKLPLGNMRLREITQTNIQQAANSLTGTPYMCRCVMNLVKAALSKAVEIEALKKNPALGIELPLRERKKIDYITESQLNEIVGAVADPVSVMVLRLGFYSGLRPEELLALTWRDIDLKKGIVSVNKALTVAEGRVYHKATKTKSSVRQVTIPSRIAFFLRQYRRWQLQELLSLSRKNPADLVFLNRKGETLRPDALARRMQKISRATGIKIMARTLRHSHATDLFSKGVAAKDVQRRLGHKSITMTMDTYTQFIEARDEDIAKLLDSHIAT